MCLTTKHVYKPVIDNIFYRWSYKPYIDQNDTEGINSI